MEKLWVFFFGYFVCYISPKMWLVVLLVQEQEVPRHCTPSFLENLEDAIGHAFQLKVAKNLGHYTSPFFLLCCKVWKGWLVALLAEDKRTSGFAPRYFLLSIKLGGGLTTSFTQKAHHIFSNGGKIWIAYQDNKTCEKYLRGETRLYQQIFRPKLEGNKDNRISRNKDNQLPINNLFCNLNNSILLVPCLDFQHTTFVFEFHKEGDFPQLQFPMCNEVDNALMDLYKL